MKSFHPLRLEKSQKSQKAEGQRARRTQNQENHVLIMVKSEVATK